MEDSLVDRRLLKSQLQRLGYHSEAYKSSEDYFKSDSPANLLFLDVNMHPVSGLEMLQMVRKAAMTPVVLVTGLESHDPIVLECCDFAKVAFLSKPVTPEKLRNVMAHHMTHNWPVRSKKEKDVVCTHHVKPDWRPPSGKTSGATAGLLQPCLYRCL